MLSLAKYKPSQQELLYSPIRNTKVHPTVTQEFTHPQHKVKDRCSYLETVGVQGAPMSDSCCNLFANQISQREGPS